MNLYYPGNHRNKDQLEEMQRLEEAGICIFCEPHIREIDTQRIVTETDHWLVTPNRFPYSGTKIHYLLVPRTHVADFLELDSTQLAGFWDALREIRATHDLDFYGLGSRCGSCKYTGGTISHLHVHLIVGDVHDPSHKPVRLKLSSRPTKLDTSP
jgi:ATP adenylyltransferase